MSQIINRNNIISQKEEDIYIPDVEIEIDDFNNFNQEILEEINYAREFPEEYVLKLEDLLKTIETKKDNYLFVESIPFIYNDLYGSLIESIKFLKSQKKLPGLIYEQTISNSCENLLYEFVNNQNHIITNYNFRNRLSKCGQAFGENYELINYEMFDPEFIIINLILCDGEQEKFERNIIFNPNIKYIGIISGILPPNNVCVIINCCEDFYSYNDKVPEEVLNNYKIKKTSFNTKKIINRRCKNLKIEIQNINWDNKRINNNDNKQREKSKDNMKIYNNIKDNKFKKKKNKKIRWDNNIKNFNEDEFFEKEFDNNYRKYQKERNSSKKIHSTTTKDDENGVKKTIETIIHEDFDERGKKTGYYKERHEVNGNKYAKGREQEYIEKEKRDMKILKDMEKKEKERILNENKKIKKIPIKLKGKKGERESYNNLQRRYEGLPEGAIEVKVKQKTITDSNGVPVIEITKTIIFEDGSVQKIVDKQPL